MIGNLYRNILSATGPVVLPAVNRRRRRELHRNPSETIGLFERALARGIAWFEPIEHLEISALFALEDLHRSGIEPRSAFIQEKIATYLATRSTFRNRLLVPDFPYDPTVDPYGTSDAVREGDEVYVRPIDPMMRRCLYSDRLGLGEEFLTELATLDDGGGYGTTHVVVGSRLLQRFSRIDRGRIEALMQSMAEKIAAAQRSSHVGDLFAERIVILQWLGRTDLIDDGWLVRLARAQNADGGWPGRPTIRPGVSNQHTTALAIVALAQFLNGMRRRPAGAAA
jgi:hypothetical protein